MTVFKFLNRIKWSYWIFFLAACSPTKYDFQKKLSPQAMQQDVDIAWNLVQKNHPSLTWYSSYNQVASAFHSVKTSLTDSLTETDFRYRLNKAIASIRCGHTNLLPSRKRQRHTKAQHYSYSNFPIAIYSWGADSMMVLQDLSKSVHGLPRGTVITAIDGHSAAEIIDSLCKHIPTDGYNQNGALSVLNRNFTNYYTHVFGRRAFYRLEYIDSSGQRSIENRNALGSDTTTRKKNKFASDPIARAQKIIPKATTPKSKLFQIDTSSSLAIMEINNFSSGGYRRFLRSSFRKMGKQSIQNLAIDLRQNGGGRIGQSTLLTRYLSKQPFRICDTVVAKDLWIYRKAQYPLRPLLGLLGILNHRGSDGRSYLASFSKRVYKPRHHPFTGQVFFITAGRSYSASILLVNAVYHQSNIHVVGEETGGAAYGNSAVILPQITLPHTKIRLRLPLYRLVMPNQVQNGHGILPHFPVPPNSALFKKGIDPKLTWIKKAIEGNFKFE